MNKITRRVLCVLALGWFIGAGLFGTVFVFSAPGNIPQGQPPLAKSRGQASYDGDIPVFVTSVRYPIHIGAPNVATKDRSDKSDRSSGLEGSTPSAVFSSGAAFGQTVIPCSPLTHDPGLITYTTILDITAALPSNRTVRSGRYDLPVTIRVWNGTWNETASFYLVNTIAEKDEIMQRNAAYYKQAQAERDEYFARHPKLTTTIVNWWYWLSVLASAIVGLNLIPKTVAK